MQRIFLKKSFSLQDTFLGILTRSRST